MATSEIVLVPLDTWAKEHLTSLITAKTQDAFDQAFESFISKEVKVTINGAHLTREQYKEQLQNERGSAQLASINIEDIVLAPILNTNETTVRSDTLMSLITTDKTRMDIQRSGLVGIFYTASFTQTSPINEHTTTSSLNIQ